MRLGSVRLKHVVLGFIAFLLVIGGYVGVKVVQYKIYIWTPNFFIKSHRNDFEKIRDGHLLFLIADHHEPCGRGTAGKQSSKKWCSRFEKIFGGIRDDFGNKLQWSWFYPYDHKNPLVVYNLNNLVYSGFGEVEFQFHHGPDTNETMPPKLKKAVKWFNSLGCMIPIGSNPEPQFGFVHGNWALDNSRKNPKWCGVNRELDILKSEGCYADFTFATFGTLAQPSQINSIYYARDSDAPKSYDTGVDAQANVEGDGFLIFQGPIGWDWKARRFDCAALEVTSSPLKHRVDVWMKRAPIVKGKPEWIFLKAYTHAFQSQDAVLSSEFRELLLHLKEVCHKKGLALHFVTAREAYNIVKAAEAGRKGNPEDYRDFILKKPVNRVMRVTSQMDNVICSEDIVKFIIREPQNVKMSFKIGPVKEMEGFVSGYSCQKVNGEYLLSVEGEGMIRVETDCEIRCRNRIISHEVESGIRHVLRINALR